MGLRMAPVFPPRKDIQADLPPSVLLSCTYRSLSYLRTPLLYLPITVIPPYSPPVHTDHCHTSVLLSCTYPSLSYLRTPLLYIPITVIPPYSS
ncbi:unnamed protein product, partial [Staurois parvus]